MERNRGYQACLLADNVSPLDKMGALKWKLYKTVFKDFLMSHSLV